MKKKKQKICTNSKHLPNGYKKPGRYKHVCSSCKKEWRFTVPKRKER